MVSRSWGPQMLDAMYRQTRQYGLDMAGMQRILAPEAYKQCMRLDQTVELLRSAAANGSLDVAKGLSFF